MCEITKLDLDGSFSLQSAEFEAAAVLDYKNISWLVLVARRVHTWLKPFLYHALVYRGPIHHRMEAHELFGTHVRHLCSLIIDTAKILAVCSSVQSLACYCAVDPSCLRHLALMRPLRLCISAFDLFASAPRFSHALFARTTHLQLLDNGLWAFDDNSWASLRVLPCLTHLAFSVYAAVPPARCTSSSAKTRACRRSSRYADAQTRTPRSCGCSTRRRTCASW
ncbi:hypothetical protein C8J57DRAFT_1374610 [Mycena rebaudengoi]|nr:hypothetical protein C8J57DRAFT_1374610 [Mycena rebaudengoi]